MTTGVHPSDGKETSWDGADAQVYRGERTRATDNGPTRAEGDPPLDTSASHFFFDNGRKKASHVYLDEVRQSRWLE